MELLKEFQFTSVSHRIPQQAVGDPFDPIRIFEGTWKGVGFNQIWRPNFILPGSDHFLELNETQEQLEFDFIPGDIPNRGLLQTDINLHGLRYLQQIFDANVFGPNNHPAGIHIENGMWLTVPSTSDPKNDKTLVRMGSIPHGTAFVAQGINLGTIATAPPIASVDITPFVIGSPASLVPFPNETTLTTASIFRTPAKDIPHVTQAMVTNPNSVLVNALTGKKIISTTTFHVNTIPVAAPASPTSGGGESNIAFLQGGAPGNAPNAQGVQVEATFWIETEQLSDGKHRILLQYSQKVLLNFKGLSWPHISVATLVKQ